MNSDFHETWYDHEGGIKDAPNKIWEQYVHAHAHNVRKRVHTFLKLVISFKQCRIWGDEEN